MMRLKYQLTIKLRCDSRFQRLQFSNQGNHFKNASACSKRTLKTTVATQLYRQKMVSVLSFVVKFLE